MWARVFKTALDLARGTPPNPLSIARWAWLGSPVGAVASGCAVAVPGHGCRRGIGRRAQDQPQHAQVLVVPPVGVCRSVFADRRPKSGRGPPHTTGPDLPRRGPRRPPAQPTSARCGSGGSGAVDEGGVDRGRGLTGWWSCQRAEFKPSLAVVRARTAAPRPTAASRPLGSAHRGRKRRVRNSVPGWTRRWAECKGSKLGLDLGVRVMYHVVTVLAVRSDQ